MLITALVLPACDAFSPDDPREERLAALDAHRTLWESEGIRAYRLTFERSCFCLPLSVGVVTITVRDDEITSVERQDSEAVPEEQWPAFDTVAGLFDLIEFAIEENAARLEVAYDPQHGHPVLVNVDFHLQMADDEAVIQVLELIVLERT